MYKMYHINILLLKIIYTYYIVDELEPYRMPCFIKANYTVFLDTSLGTVN